MTDPAPRIAALPDRALSIRQPWAWAILNAGKRIENRPRRFHYRGPICLHASLYQPTPSDDAQFVMTWNRKNPVAGELSKLLDMHPDFARGGIIGTAEIVDLVEESDSPWFFGPYGLVLANVQPVPFIPVKGALGLFRWKDQIRD